jgi:hypothetical protein
MAVKKALKKVAVPAAKKPVKKPLKKPIVPLPVPPCSKLFEFFNSVTLGPGGVHDSATPQNVDCYQWLHVWVLAKHATNLAMDNITVELVFELPGKRGATGLANLEIPYVVNVRPTPLQVNSGPPIGGYGGFVVRSPIIGPGVRAIVINGGPQTYDFTLWGYATH